LANTRKPDRERSDTEETLGPGSPGQLDTLISVLEEIRSGRAQTRPTLIARTGLTRAIVVQRVSELLARGLVGEAELAAPTGGRAARTLVFRSALGHVLSADIGAASIVVGLADISGRLVDHHEEPADISSGPRVVLGRVQELFDQLLAAQDGSLGRLWGIGIGLPGPVEFSAGRPISPPIMPGWDGVPVRDLFAERYRAPVWVDNDVNLMALGELSSGVAREHDVVVFVKIGVGVGAGILVGGQLLRGAQGCAGDVGHIQVSDDPSVVCRCGKLGCLEALAGGAAIGRRAETAARSGRSAALEATLSARGRIDAADVARVASHGDPVARELITSAGQLVGSMLSAVVNVINPSLVVIGGGVAGAGDPLLASIRQAIYARSLPLATRDLLIRTSVLERTGGILGATTMVLDQLFSKPVLTGWLSVGHPGGQPELSSLAA
jgi:glucokinase-like ROK family protein